MRRLRRGQSAVEFALLLPMLLMLVGGIVQYGLIFATRHALIQVGRDTGRWAATQTFDPCRDAATATPTQPLTMADSLAQQSSLIGYAAGDWGTTNFVVHPDNTALPASPPNVEGVEVVWSFAGPCPPVDSRDAAFVTIRLSHRAPVVLPGFSYLPGLGTCDASGCYLPITTTAQFRMEPPPAP